MGVDENVVVLDLTGLSCPLPVLRANKAAKNLIPGEILELHVTDPNAPKDLTIFCENTGHEILEQTEDGGTFKISIRKIVEEG